MRDSESPMVIKSMLLVVYGRHVSRELKRRQMYRSGDQLEGAVLGVRNNIAEARSPESRRDFVHKLKIADKELCEAEGIIWALSQTDGITDNEKSTLCNLATDLSRILNAAILTAKRNQ